VELGAEEPLSVTPEELVERLRAAANGSTEMLLAFDGDGTLWSGDVGEDVFHEAVHGGLLREAAREALAQEAASHAVDASGSPSEIAARLFAAYLRGEYAERRACAMMSFCYAGFTLTELGELVRRTFAKVSLEARLQRELAPIFEFARELGLRTVVVSASPQPIVEEASTLWGIASTDVFACRTETDGGRILPRLAAAVPYAEDKPGALRAAAPNRELLASFGDNVFDMELLRASKIAVAVRPKPALRSRLHTLPGVLILRS
jgi:phosphoserine phosphatase